VNVPFSGFVVPLIETGIGIGCSMVLLSTISLSSLPRAEMTAGAGIYTLVRRVSGNLSYAILATVVERRTIFHNAPLIALANHDPVSPAGPLSYSASIVSQSARMSAYTDCYTLLAGLFVLALPLTLLLPKRGVPTEEPAAVTE
jgi:hypothetical protein